MENREIVFDIKGKKISRDLPKHWGYDISDIFCSTKNAFMDFCRYVHKMQRALFEIKKFYKEEFNKDNSYTIDEYIGIFDNTIEKLNGLILNEEWLKTSKKNKTYLPLDKQNTFAISHREQYYKLNRKAFVFEYGSEMVGFSDEAYGEILSLAKKIFMIEKMCSFTTRKFWQKEITDVKDLDLQNKPFKIIARVIMPKNWRANEDNKTVMNYYNNKIYTSSSLIDEKHKTNLFMFQNWKHSRAAILILEYDDKKFLCADTNDSFSEENINGLNPLDSHAFYSTVSRIDQENVNENNHEFFSQAVEIATPKGIISKLWGVSEINMKNAKVVGVIAPNKISIEFAKEEAEKRNVPLFLDNIFEQ